MRFHLAGDFQLAFDLLTFQIARAAFKEGHYFVKPLDINLTVTEPCPHRRRDNQGFTLADQGTAKFRAACERLPLEWIGDTGEGAFAKFQALPLIDRQALFTAAVACALKGQLSLEAHPESPSRPLPAPSALTSPPSSGRRPSTGSSSKRRSCSRSQPRPSGPSGLLGLPRPKRANW